MNIVIDKNWMHPEGLGSLRAKKQWNILRNQRHMLRKVGNPPTPPSVLTPQALGF